MRKILFLLILYAYSFVGHAQDSISKPAQAINRHLGLEVSAGYSMPLGSYASSDKENAKSGYATGGWHLQITFDWMGKNDLGLALQYTYQTNPMKGMANQVFPKGIPDSIGSGSWSNHYLMAGPVFMKTIKRIHIDAKVLGGIMVSSSGIFNTPDPTDTLTNTYHQNIATGFALQISAGIGYAISKHVVFKFNLSLLGGWPGISRQYGAQLLGYKEYFDPISGLRYYKAVYSAPVDYDIKKTVSTLNPSIGLVYRF